MRRRGFFASGTPAVVLGAVFATNDDSRLGNGRYRVHLVALNGNGTWKGTASSRNTPCVEDERYRCDLYDGTERLERPRGVRAARRIIKAFEGTAWIWDHSQLAKAD